MEKLPVKSIIAFRKKKDSARITLIRNLRKKKEPIKDDQKKDGGDYWISCCSTLANVFKTNEIDLIEEKIMDLQQRKQMSTLERTKNQYQKNIDLLSKFEEFDFTTLKPGPEIKIVKKKDEFNILDILGLPVYLRPSHVFSFHNKDFKEIGAVWFVAQKNGFNKIELAVFCDVLHRYLQKYYCDEYKVSLKYCIVIDVFTTQSLSYEHLIEEQIQSPLIATLNDLKLLL